MTKKQFNIGDTFLSWEVIEPVPNKKYRYLCRCTECGKEKEFGKYNLLNGRYAPCKSCGYSRLGNIPLIKKHWNSELNECIFTKPQDFDLTKSYWFMCENGHNFRSTIKDFSLNKCLSCQHKLKEDTPRLTIMQFAQKLLKEIYGCDIIVERYFVEIPNKKIVFYLVEADRFNTYRNYYKEEAQMLTDIVYLKTSQNTHKLHGYSIYSLNVGEDFEKNVDSLCDLMLQCV